MDTINVKPLGEIKIKEPDNWCAIADLSMGWVNIKDDHTTEIMRTRICAAAIGIDWDAKKEAHKLPKYDWARGDLFVYGSAVQDRLLRWGVTVSELCLIGVSVFQWLTDLIPSQEEVEKVEDFSAAVEERPILSP